MSATLEDLREEVRENLGGESESTSSLADLVTDGELDRWLNRGIQRLDFYKANTSALTWDAEDISIALPSDFVRAVRVTPATDSRLDPYEIFGQYIRFIHPDGASDDGTATLYYWARWPTITGSQDTQLPPIGDEAIVYYALYRFYNRLASGRAEYRKMAVQLGSNAVDLAEIVAIGQNWFGEFQLIKDELQTTHSMSNYFGS